MKDSLNIPAVKVSGAVGRDLVRRVAGDFGLDSELAAGPALALGAFTALSVLFAVWRDRRTPKKEI